MQLGFFDIQGKYEKLTNLGDPLVKIGESIDFTMFEEIYHRAFPANDGPTATNPKNAGRKPIPASVIIRIVFLKRLYALSNEQTEFQLADRHSFQRFVGLDANGTAPDFTTIWKRENTLSNLGCIDLMFRRFDRFLADRGFVADGGAIVDATIVEAPGRRNTREENGLIKEGKIPKGFRKNRHKKSQKDVDARWTKKRGVNYYGYENRVMIDSRRKLVRSYGVTPANVHDSVPARGPIRGGWIDGLYGDGAYPSPGLRELMASLRIGDRPSEKGCGNRKSTSSQMKSNRQKSKTGRRIEHAFGFIENSMNSMYIGTIGLRRAKYLQHLSICPVAKSLTKLPARARIETQA